mmetsp:Transcript_9014/g.25424  ORF Transcript_9014/g.25424 Transcript_9014/m.25424 type:complete len:138 (+) Transcript_9014:333-746(+)
MAPMAVPIVLAMGMMVAWYSIWARFAHHDMICIMHVTIHLKQRKSMLAVRTMMDWYTMLARSANNFKICRMRFIIHLNRRPAALNGMTIPHSNSVTAMVPKTRDKCERRGTPISRPNPCAIIMKQMHIVKRIILPTN